MWAGSQPVRILNADMCTIAAMAGSGCCYMYLHAVPMQRKRCTAQPSAVSRRPAFRRRNVAGQTWDRTKQEYVSDYPSFHLLMHPCIIPSKPVCNLASNFAYDGAGLSYALARRLDVQSASFVAALLSNLLKCCSHYTFLPEIRRHRQVIHKQYSESPFPADQFFRRCCELVCVLAGARKQMCYAAGQMPHRVCMVLHPSVITLYPTCTRKDWGACGKDVERGYGTSPPQPGPAMTTHTTPR